MRTACALLLVLGGAALARATDPGRSPASATTANAQVGDSYGDVLAKLGKPTSEIDAGAVHLLFYPTTKVKLRNGLVAEVTEVGSGTNATPPPAAAPGLPPATGPGQETLGGIGQLRVRKDAVENEIAVYEFEILNLFRKGDYPELDRRALQAIKDRARFGDGSWKIVCFHEALRLPPHTPEGVWQAQEDNIGKWENAAPASISAKVTHVEFLTAYAWQARGTGEGSQVKAANLELFRSRMVKAQAILQAATELPAKSPMTWYAGITVALGQHWSLQDTVNFYIEGKKYEPEFWYYDTSLAYYLLPNWNGKPGDWEHFAEAERQRPGSLGSEGYARVVYAMKSYYRNVFKQTKAQWPEAKEGFQALIQRYPDSLQLVNQYAYLASNAGDKEAARWAFDKMGVFVDPYMWTADSLRIFRTWAYQEN